MRKAYSKKLKNSKKTIKIKKTCIKDKGKPGKGIQLFRIPAYDVGLLSSYGYSLSEPHTSRIKAIKKACKDKGLLGVLRHLVALRTLQKSNEKIYKKLNKDVEWMKIYYEEKK